MATHPLANKTRQRVEGADLASARSGVHQKRADARQMSAADECAKTVREDGIHLARLARGQISLGGTTGDQVRGAS